jgi:N-acetylmuramoyl-L-alanine amidase
MATVLGLAAPASATHDFRLTSDRDQARDVVPLAGRTIVIDPGHQLGNHNFPRKINRLVPAGGFKKPCNTTGTATNGGFPEATFTWRVSRLLKERLQRLGAKVRLTRHANRQDEWGPCVDVRGRDGNRLPADLKLSIHGDGS